MSDLLFFVLIFYRIAILVPTGVWRIVTQLPNFMIYRKGFGANVPGGESGLSAFDIFFGLLYKFVPPKHLLAFDTSE